MLARLLELPLLLVLAGLGFVSMYLPAAHALSVEAFFEARMFFYSGTLGLIFCAMVGLAFWSRRSPQDGLQQLLALFGAFTLLPVALAVPFYEALRTTTFLNAYMEMVSSLTTTGASFFAPERLSGTLHLWRAQVGWMGGLLIWVAAAAILAPLNLGGFEVTARAEPGEGDTRQVQTAQQDPTLRLRRSVRALLPIYAALTLALWVILLIAGDTPLTALCHAMSLMATSGISPEGGLGDTGSGIWGEVILFVFFVFALSRITFSSDTVTGAGQTLFRDPEFRLGLLIVLGVPTALFLRHWVGAFELDETDDLQTALRAFWGALFTTTSFLTTTGFVSMDWDTAQAWSGLPTPALILMGLALVGGGVATTAGGVKLLRVFVLYLNGLREMERLVHPSSVSGSGAVKRRIRRQGAYIAWIFFMLFALSLALITVLLAGLGLGFQNALVLAVASLSTTGPLMAVATEPLVVLADLGAWAKAVLAAAMVLGRLETLAIIALLSLNLWRN